MELAKSAKLTKFLNESQPVGNFTFSLRDEGVLKVEPSSIQFEMIQPGILYVMTFSVRNNTKIASRIRIQAPKTSFFALNYIPCGPVAPGLDIRAEVECQIPVNSNDLMFTDKIVVIMGKHQVELPLFGCKPYANVRFEKIIELGNIIKGQTIAKDILFENIGGLKTTVKLTPQPNTLIRLTPTRFDLDPLSSSGEHVVTQMVVKAIFDAKELGSCRELVKVSISDALEEFSLDISANIVEQKLTLLSAGNKGVLDAVNFGNLFFGQEKVISAILVNSGPQPLNFAVNYEEDEDNNSNAAEESSGQIQLTNEDNNPYLKSLTISPKDGILRPFSQIPIKIIFKPELIEPTKGFIKPFTEEEKRKPKLLNRRATLDCPDIDQKIVVNLQGTVISPYVTVDPTILRFGECPVNDRRDILITLTNKTVLPTVFQFPLVAAFKFSPTTGTLLSMESTSVVATFQPPQLGKFKNTIQLSIGKGLEMKDIRLIGESQNRIVKNLIGGIDKQPEDFVVHHKFVVPLDEAQARIDKKSAALRKTQTKMAELSLQNLGVTKMIVMNNNVGVDHNGLGGTATIIPKGNEGEIGFGLNTQKNSASDLISNASSKARDYIYNMDGLDSVQLAHRAEDMAQLESHHKKVEHNKIYDNYLQRSYHVRLENTRISEKTQKIRKGAVDFEDPFGVNMGMERGLDEPVLPIPNVNEPLWLSNRKEGATAQGRLPVDENRLIQKKYGNTPSTQAELRDCSTELTADELKLVEASHKTLDFGRVNVGAITAKNFVVSNDLKHSVLVKIEDLEPELQQSKALCQIIPDSAMAGFDIYFCSRTVGKFKKPFTVKINGMHTSKCFVVAEVVPIEVIMSKDNLVMEFSSDSLMPSISQDIVLTNPGNAVAEFLWGNAGAFQCIPDKGTIQPGKSSVISVKWTPVTGKRNEEELGLHITGGIDQNVKVIGVLKETKAEFVEKRLNLGSMAVGTEKVVRAHVKNVGQNPLVFFMNQSSLDDRLGITLSPTVDAIDSPNDSVPVTISITPRAAMSYDNLIISAKVRGGKQISLRLSGASIIPKLELVEQNFLFGPVAVGSEYRLPLTIMSKTAIPTTLVLDLNAHPEFLPNIKGLTTDDTLSTASMESNPTILEDKYGNLIKQFQKVQDSDSPRSIESNSSKKKISNYWKIYMLPNAILSAEIIFRPTEVKNHNFKLMLYLQGIPGDRTLMRDVSGQGNGSLLEVSRMVVDFGDRVVSRDPLSRVSYFLETMLKNVSTKQGITYEIRELPEVSKEYDPQSGASIDLEKQKKGGNAGSNEALNPIFFVSPMRGDLPPGASSPIRITFQPQSSGDYSKKLEIYLKDQPDPNRAYMTVLCLGSGLFPRLTFDRQHVELPPVPLNVTSRASFIIYNNGYDGLNLIHNVSPIIPIPLEISYPDGKEVGIMTDKVRVFIGAKSNIPMSWSGKIEFFDKDGERFFITVSGISDSCLLTVYPFVRLYNDTYGFIGLDEQPVKFLKKSEIAELRAEESKRKIELRRLRSLERQRAVESKDAGDSGSVANSSTSPTQKKGKSMKNQNASSSTSLPADNRKHSLGGISNGDYNSSFEGVELDRPEIEFTKFDESEAVFVIKWLNKNYVVKKYLDEQKFPYCILEGNGESLFEYIEQMSGRKLPMPTKFAAGSDTGDATSNQPRSHSSSTTRRMSDASASSSHDMIHHSASSQTETIPKANSDKNARTVAANRLVYRYQQILNFLITNGALLSHINPIYLLNLQDHIVAQEYDLTRDKSLRFTPAMLAERRKSWESDWLSFCKRSWLEILYQSVKIYILERVNYKDYTKMPGVILPNREEVPPPPPPPMIESPKKVGAKMMAPASPTPAEKVETKKKKKKAGSDIPKDIQGSNVYSASEAILLSWLSFHVDRGSNLRDDGANLGNGMSGGGASDFSRLGSLNRRMVDFGADLKDLFGFLQVIHSHLPDVTAEDEVLAGYTLVDRNRRNDVFDYLTDAMEELRISFGVTLMDLSSSRTLLLMSLHLFFQLPNLIPKTKIEFNGLLGDVIKKKIELTNPSKKSILYDVTLKGSSDFSIETGQQLMIPPESTIEYPVTLVARFFNPVTAKLTFWGVLDPTVSHAAGSTMSFQLISHMTGRKPLDKITRSVFLHEMESFKLELRNPFNKDCNFSFQLLVQHIPVTVDESVRAANINSGTTTSSTKASSGKGNNFAQKLAARLTGQAFKPTVFTKQLPEDAELTMQPSERKYLEEEYEMEGLFRQPFWCNEDHIAIPKNGMKYLQVYLLPFILGQYNCQVVLEEKEMGEFCYQVDCNVGFPKPSDHLEFNAVRDTKIYMSLRLASKSFSFEKALGILTETRIKNPNKKIRARSILQNLLAAPLTNEELGQSSFVVEYVPTYFISKKQIPFISEYIPLGKNAPSPLHHKSGSSQHQTASSTQQSAAAVNKYKKTLKTTIEIPNAEDLNNLSLLFNTSVIQFTPERAGKYTSKLVLYPKDNIYDVRVVEVTAKVSMPDSKMVFEFKGPARKPISQLIPIVNESTTDWSLMATVSGKGFSGPKSLNVHKGETVNYVLTFMGAYAGVFEGSLVLRNIDGKGGDSFQYHLVGHAEDPLAEDHLSFRCEARKKSTMKVPLNPIQVPSTETKKSAGLVFDVETDIPYVNGPEQVELSATGQVILYEITFLSPTGGTFSGFIQFKEKESGVIQWYTVTIEVAEASEEKVIDITSVVRKAVAVEITLDNPTSEAITFEVALVGEGLIGESSFQLQPKTVQNRNDTYELVYSPLLSGSFTGSISFWNEKVGSLWYKLQLTASPAPPIVVDTIESMIGITNFIAAPVENPLGEQVTFFVSSSDPEQFFVVQEKIVLNSYQQTTFDIHFRPSRLNELERGFIKLTNPQFGDVIYEVSGMGIAPGKMPLVRIDATLNEIGSSTVIFRNPFAHPLPIEIKLLQTPIKELTSTNTTSGRKNSTITTLTSQSPTTTDAMMIQRNVFSLLIRKLSVDNTIVIPAKSNHHIAIGFTPTVLGLYEATLEIRSMVSNRQLTWTYPLEGVTEAGTAQRFPPLKTALKTTLMKEIVVPLEGLRFPSAPVVKTSKWKAGITSSSTDIPPLTTVPYGFDMEDFSIDVVSDPKWKSLVLRSFRAQAVELVTLSPNDPIHKYHLPGRESVDYAMKYRLLFEPLRTFSTEIELVIGCKNKGKWKVHMDLEASEPTPDDIIRLVAPVGSVERVTFRLSNRFLGFSPFRAYFSLKSSQHFTVSPTSGTLAPYGSEGTQFLVSFAPVEYGTVETAILVIETDDAQWNYELRGSYPDNTANHALVKSKVVSSNNNANGGRTSIISNTIQPVNSILSGSVGQEGTTKFPKL